MSRVSRVQASPAVETLEPLEADDPNDVHSVPTRPGVEIDGSTQSGVVAVPALPATTMPRAIPTPLQAFPALLEARLLAELSKRPDSAPTDVREAVEPPAVPAPTLSPPDLVEIAQVAQVAHATERKAPARRQGNDRTVPTKRAQIKAKAKRSRFVGHVLLAIGGTLLGASLVFAYAFASGLLRMP